MSTQRTDGGGDNPTPTNDLKPFLFTEDVAFFLRVSRPRVYEMCRLDLIPHVRMGRHIRFDPVALSAWISEGGTTYPGGWRKEVAR